jgi:Mrp family chromosome partitioning ATPase
MRRFLEEARRKFDIVVFDTPPLDAATDAVVLGSQADAVTIIVRAGKTNYMIARERLEIFKTIPANLIGVILNGSANTLLENYYSYYHY